ncbi:zinc finger BED domain-containing protein DAYSLEEPER-like isoform X2 [Durio zibethinus]|nr:zinc finger BED domain-containing protein DAYSLEEPER-like isoform X2 [Durio zibethinus]XP_022765824.1 zinc finger BED domain-containing protein DAYSLEEPER-like isoform X2 [Durio zibethinus]
MMDMALIPNVDPINIGLGSSEKGNVVPAAKPRKKTMTSVYHVYFETAPDGKTRRCKFCGQNYSIATATGSLGRHFSNRHPGYDKSGEAVTSSAPQPTATVIKRPQPQGKAPQVDYDHLNWLLIKWLILATLPPSTLEEKWLANSFKFLNPSIQLWPGEKYKAIFREVFKSMKEDVRVSLEQVSSKVSVTLGFWTSYEQMFYMSITCQWIDENWSFQKVFLDICRVNYPCTSSEIYNSMVKVLKMYNVDYKMYNVEYKVLSCTHDIGQNAVHACHTLKEDLGGQKVGPFCYIPCAACTLSLIIDDALRTAKPVIAKVREFVQELNTSLDISEGFIQLTTAY